MPAEKGRFIAEKRYKKGGLNKTTKYLSAPKYFTCSVWPDTAQARLLPEKGFSFTRVRVFVCMYVSVVAPKILIGS